MMTQKRKSRHLLLIYYLNDRQKNVFNSCTYLSKYLFKQLFVRLDRVMCAAYGPHSSLMI